MARSRVRMKPGRRRNVFDPWHCTRKKKGGQEGVTLAGVVSKPYENAINFNTCIFCMFTYVRARNTACSAAMVTGSDKKLVV